jgi:hypothetical protein
MHIIGKAFHEWLLSEKMLDDEIWDPIDVPHLSSISYCEGWADILPTNDLIVIELG